MKSEEEGRRRRSREDATNDGRRVEKEKRYELDNIRQVGGEEQKEAERRRRMLEDKKTGVERGKLSN